jgi:UDP-glucose 4-epimerase
MAEVLITGGAGYIGSHMVRYLLAHGHKPVIIDNLSYGHIESIPDKTPFYKGDIADRNLLIDIFSRHKIAAVMHFSAFAFVGESVTDPKKYYDNNVVKTLTLINTMLERNIKHFVFSSSCATYGMTAQGSIDETHSQNPISPYGQTKLMVEKIVQDYDQAYGLKSILLRYFNAAGAHDDGCIGESHNPETHLIPLALQTITDNSKKLKVFGIDYPTPDGTCIRDYIHVNDLASAHLKALEYVWKNNTSDYFNLGSENGYSVRQIIDTCTGVAGKPVMYTEDTRRPGDPAKLVADAAKARKILGWQTQYSLERIIETAWRWETNRLF